MLSTVSLRSRTKDQSQHCTFYSFFFPLWLIWKPAFSCQVQKVPTCSSITCHRSLETRTSCRCSCLSETWSQPKSLSTNRQTLASALVRSQRENENQIFARILGYFWTSGWLSTVITVWCFRVCRLVRRIPVLLKCENSPSSLGLKQE